MTAWPIVAMVQVSVVVAAALLAALGLRRRSAATRHWVLAAGLIAAIAVLPLSLVSGRWVPASWRFANAARASRLTANGLRSASSPIVGTATTANATGDAWWIVSGAQGSAPPTGALAGPTLDRTLGIALLGTWGLGSALAVAAFMTGLVRLRRLRRESSPLTAGVWRRAADDIARRYGVATPVRLVLSHHPTLLATWGLQRPVIALPKGAAAWAQERVGIVLAHELAHVARRDWLVLILATALRAAFWFNPLLWIFCRRLRIESELACDDQVLALGTSGADYASHLLDLARLLRADRHGWLPVAPITPASHLRERIRTMLVPSLDRRTVSAAARVTTVVIGFAFTILIAAAGAQSSFYSLAGVVRDATNRVLPAARLVLVNRDNQSKYEVVSDRDGRYAFVGLPAASYTLNVAVAGFASFTTDLMVSAVTTRDIQLEVGTLQETISVRGTATVPPDATGREKGRLLYESLTARALEVCADPARNTRVGGNIIPPRKVFDMRPVYPQYLRDAGIGGVVTMTATIGTDGQVRDIQDLKGPHADLEAAAEQAVRQWQFSQTWLNCDAIEVKMRVTTNFSAP